jgi:C1A family cysteine protease
MYFIIIRMNGKQLAVLLAVIGAAAVLLNVQNASPVSEFEAWKSKHAVKYASEFENAYRERIFLENFAKINAHNSNEYNTYEMGLNQFSALTTEEFVQQYLGTIVAESSNDIESVDDVQVGDVDWTTQGATTPVKNQGSCGSCWAFSATGALEGLSYLTNKVLESFSEQQLVDCSGSYGNQACNGGLMDNAFKYVKDHGILHEDQYVYKGVKQTCSQNAGPFKISGFTDIKNCNDLATGLSGRPIAVAVDATNWSPYKSGVFNNCKTALNHGVLLVGATDQYWKVKNSWGATWGEAGFVRLTRGNTCGICNVASYPTK